MLDTIKFDSTEPWYSFVLSIRAFLIAFSLANYSLYAYKLIYIELMGPLISWDTVAFIIEANSLSAIAFSNYLCSDMSMS